MQTKRYWLRGGIIGFFFIPAIFLLSFLGGSFERLFPLFVSPLTFLTRDLVENFCIRGASDSSAAFGCGIFVAFLVYGLTYAFVGVVLGFLYGKIKNRKQVGQI